LADSVSRAVRTIAILPVKRFPAAKQRLRPGLEPPQREDLAQAMFSDVLAALSEVALDGIVVVTASPSARTIAHRHGAHVVEDRETGHNAAAALGVQAALAQAAERVLLVPGDCPALDPGEVGSLLDHPASPPSVLIVPDRHGTGTNALLITPPDALVPSFGPGSCQRHLELARASGLQAEVLEVPSLALDIDTPEDLELFTATLERAGSTRQLLGPC
jgi:2-phospho-L-lactate/phosphoenolpyruvate guanylyltransferase